jgi:hypothetical protein
MADRPVFSDTQFVRVKTSKRETYFVTSRPKDNIRFVKTVLKVMSGIPTEDMKLYLQNRLLEDESSLYDQQVSDGCIIYLVTKKPTGEWETIANFLPGRDELSAFARSTDSPTKTIT